jgi:hypothetical protein
LYPASFMDCLKRFCFSAFLCLACFSFSRWASAAALAAIASGDNSGAFFFFAMQSPLIFNIGYPVTCLYLPSEQYRRGKTGREEAVKGKGNNEKDPLIPKQALAAFGRGAVMGDDDPPIPLIKGRR